MNKIVTSLFLDKKNRIFIIASLAVYALLLTTFLINNRFHMNDFKVMYMAAEALWSNNDVYNVTFGLDTGYYKYSPFTLLFFLPYTIFSYTVASLIHYFIISFSAIGTVVILNNIFIKHFIGGKKVRAATLFVILLCIILQMERELYLGNTNMILLFMVTLSVKLMLDNKSARAALLWGAVILTKPYFVVALLPLILYKRYKFIVQIGGVLLAYVLGSMLVVGFGNGIELYHGWYLAMANHTSYLFSEHTIFALLNYYVGINVPESWFIVIYILTALLSYALFFFLDPNRKNKEKPFVFTSRAIVIHIFFLVALAPTMLTTDREHFLFALPFISVLIFQVRNAKNKIWLIPLILLMILFEGNSIEIIGRQASIKFDEWGLLGIGNILLMTSVLFLHFKSNRFWELDK